MRRVLGMFCVFVLALLPAGAIAVGDSRSASDRSGAPPAGQRLTGAAARQSPREASTPLDTIRDIDWAVRVIPLPHEMAITRGLVVRAAQVYIAPPAAISPPVTTALEALRSFALGGDDSPCHVRLAIVAEDDPALPAGLAERLRTLPNADQAYAVLARQTSSAAVEILLAGNTPQGLLFAARTLEQLVSPPSPVTATTSPG